MSGHRVLHERYRLERVLGEGTMARTWLAVDEERERALLADTAHPFEDRDQDGVPDAARVAIKEVPLARLQTWKHRELLEREGTVLRQLNHGGIPRCFEAFELEHEGLPSFYLVEEWIDGELLLDRLERAGRFEEREVRHLLRDVLEILRYLHERDMPVVHRDIKPSNLIVRPDGSVVLIDFGAVREVAAWQEDGTTVVGTFGYMAPEQLQGAVSTASDIYALAATACHLLTGLHPRDMPVRGHPFLLDFRGHARVSEDLAELLDAMLRPDVDRRLADAAQILDVLDEIEATAATADEAALAAPGAGALLGAAQQGPRELTFTRMLYAIDLAPRWQHLTLLLGLIALFFGPLGWAISLITAVLGSGAVRQTWHNARVLRGGTLLRARVTALRPRGGQVTVEYTFALKRRTLRGAIDVRAKRTRGLRVGDLIHVIADPQRPEDHVPILGDERELLPELHTTDAPEG